MSTTVYQFDPAQGKVVKAAPPEPKGVLTYAHDNSVGKVKGTKK